MEIKLPENLLEAVFLERVNRFVARVRVAGREAIAHVPSSGRMRELLTPGAAVHVAPHDGAGHRTEYRLLLARNGGVLVSIDSLLPNRLLHKALLAGKTPGFGGYTGVRREFPYRRGRIDFLLDGGEERWLVEVKSVTLVEKGTARFPDAPSRRGARHLEELSLALGEGFRTAVIFVVQRQDGKCFAPNDNCDPLFGIALREAYRKGVAVHALRCRVGKDAVKLSGALPVIL